MFRDLSALLKSSWPAVELNIEGNPLHQLMDHVRTVRPPAVHVRAR